MYLTIRVHTFLNFSFFSIFHHTLHYQILCFEQLGFEIKSKGMIMSIKDLLWKGRAGNSPFCAHARREKKEKQYPEQLGQWQAATWLLTTWVCLVNRQRSFVKEATEARCVYCQPVCVLQPESEVFEITDFTTASEWERYAVYPEH